MPEISIVTPVYNAYRYLTNMITSVNSQGFSSYEWLICDDGSTDDSLELLKRAAANNPRIHIFTQENSGVAVARNTCLKHVSGKYLMFLDSDDALAENALHTLYDQMAASDADICIYAWYIHQFDDLFSYIFEKRETESTAEDRYRMILTDAYLCGGGYPWNKIWKVSAIEKNGAVPGFDAGISYMEDKLWTLERLDDMKKQRVIFYNEPLYNYYIRPDSLSHFNGLQDFNRKSENITQALQFMLDYIRENHPSVYPDACDMVKKQTEWLKAMIAQFLKTSFSPDSPSEEPS